MAVAVAVAVGVPGSPVRAAEPDVLRVEPGELKVDGGATFSVDLVQDVAVPTTGVETYIVFDPKLVQVTDIRPGPAYASALFLYGSVDDGSSTDLQAFIAKGNKTGAVGNMATFLLPGSGSVPAGPAVFLTVDFKARYGEGGTTPLSLQRWLVLDEAGNEVKVTAASGDISVGAAAAPSGYEEAPSAAVAVDSGPVGAAGPEFADRPAEVRVYPESVEVTPGSAARAYLVVKAGIPASSVTGNLTFDPALLEITGVEPGPAWADASIIAGEAGQALPDAIAEANTSGIFRQAGVFLLPNMPDPPSIENVFLTVTLKGRAAGTSALRLDGQAVVDMSGKEVPVASPAAGSGTESAGGGSRVAVDPAFLVVLGIILAVVVGIGLIARSGVIPARWRRRWPYVVSLLLALIPVLMFAGMVAMLVANALPVVDNPGIAGLFSGRFASQFSLGGVTGDWGLLPAAWGTVLITFIAIVIALPVSLAMAVIASEFPMGPLGRFLRPMLGVLAGIPPIVYAVAGAVFVTLVVAPKFAGSPEFSSFSPGLVGADPSQWPPPDVPWTVTAFPWPPNSGGIPSTTLLGGVLIALLVIPFMAPLIFDAMRNVPRVVREASFALGANRAYTLRRVILPHAMPGIIAAVALATLKALGDVLIIALAVGWQAETMPDPVVDILERTSNLAVTGANLLGNLQTGAGTYCDPKFPACAVGYSSALALLVVAAIVVISATLLERRLRRRLHA